MNKNKELQCVQCGTCCFVNLCSVGKKGENGICKFLIYKNKKYYCHLYLTGVIKKSDIEIGMGCRLKRNILIYNYYLNMRNKIQNEIFSKENKGYQML